jgi:hypothetical protein
VKKVIIASVVAAVLLLACGEEEGVTPPPGPERLLPTTPAYVLKNVEIAFNGRDVNILRAMLSENFVFHFDPRDVGSSPPGGIPYIIPESWTRAEFLKAVANMFDKALRISFSIETDNVGKPRPEETEYYAENVPAELLVMLDELNGYIAYSASAFAFESYRAEGGGKCWRLTEWRDYGSYYDEKAPGVSPATIGKILAVYYGI